GAAAAAVRPITSRLPTVRTRVVAGKTVPVTIGQALRTTAVAKIESWLSHTLIGGRLRKVATQQQRALAEIATDLIRNTTGFVGDPVNFLSNIAEGAKVLRGRASELYESVKAALPSKMVRARSVKEVQQLRASGLIGPEDFALSPQGMWTKLQDIRIASSRAAHRAARSENWNDFRKANIDIKAAEELMDSLFEQGTRAAPNAAELSALYKKAKATWSQASAMEEFGQVMAGATEGAHPSLLEGFLKPRPQVVGGKRVAKAVGAVKPDLARLTKAFGTEGAKDLVRVLELIDRSQQGGTLGGALITIGSLIEAGGLIAVGDVVGAVTSTARTYGGLWAISRALAKPLGRGAVVKFLEAVTKGDTPVRINFLAQKVADAAEESETAKAELPKPPVIEVGPADLRQDTEIMLKAKEGEITP
ncbi:hypothetical protein LCGC14_2763940, partial [marine sediment metagenome]